MDGSTRSTQINNSNQTIYLTDLDHCTPLSALSSEPHHGYWRKLEYKAASGMDGASGTDQLSGTMLMAAELTDAPEITYPLHMNGWYTISFGVVHMRGFDNVVQVKLTSDPCFSLLTLRARPDRGIVNPRDGILWGIHIQEVFWKAADLTNQQILLRQLCTQVADQGDQLGSRRYAKVGLVYIKLTPLSAEEVKALQDDRQRTDTRRLFAHNDASSFQYSHLVTTPEDIKREIEPYRNTDFSRLYWEAAYGDMMLYLGKAGRLPTLEGEDEFYTVGEYMYTRTWRTFRDQGIDPLKVAVEYAHEINVELHAGFRTAGFYHSPLTEAAANWQSFYAQHPELRGVGRDGKLSPRISYTYPETRRYVTSLLREVAEYGVDGIALLYVRRPPLVEYEPPLVDGFIAEYGQDPRTLDPKDPRWLAYRCRTLTQFMREVRQEMDAVARERGQTRRIEVSAVVSGREEENLMDGMDIKGWIAAGLVDTIVPNTMSPRLNTTTESWPDLRDVTYWVELTKGTACKLALNIMPRTMPPEEYRRKAEALYAAGVENIFYWDCNGRATYNFSWDALRRMGHREEIQAWMHAGEPDLEPERMIFNELGGWDMNYDTPG
ncbi:MAG: hypothetical protein EXR62_03420 [Chloroflexi bacterium]|nr:hypothetical protein [Chloroflexota bacterium]